MRAIEERAAAMIDSGRAVDALANLSTLADEHTLRERPHELLMVALAAAGRTPEALRTYDDFRRRLGDELGIEPSPALADVTASCCEPSRPTSRHPRRICPSR